MRTFDINKQFEEIKKHAVNSVNKIFPVSGKDRVIVADKVWVDDNVSATDYQGQAKTKAKEGTWGVPVYASLVMKDKSTGKVLDKMPRVKLFNLPKHTARLSFIVGGNEYQVQNQLRLKPGAYTIRKQNGELKTQVNLAAGKNFDLIFDERTGVFKISKVGGGQANIPLYPILENLGVTKPSISQMWGDRLSTANLKFDPKAVDRAKEAFGTKGKSLDEYFKDTKISPDTTKLTLGRSFDRVDGPMLLAASKKLLDVHLGKVEPEDRDSLEYKELHSLEDFIQERIEKNHRSLSMKVLRNLDSVRKTKLTQIINPGMFSAPVESFFVQDDKSSSPEQTNPLEMLSGQYRTTMMGEGGIGSVHAVTENMRNLHPTHYGFIDPVHTPEGERIGVNLHLPMGAVKDGKELKAVFQNAKTGAKVALTPAQAFEATVAFPGQTGPDYKVSRRGETLTVPKSKVDFFSINPKLLFSPSTNLIPFLSSNQGNRTMMGAKMLEQAISLKHREAPLVQVKATGDASMESLMGQASAVHAPEDGVVKSVTDDVIVIKTSSGDISLDLYDNFTLNRKSFLKHYCKVKAGDKVKKGQLLADSNFTKGGTLALGVNLKTAYLPYKGLNYEDGIVITDNAANKLTSEHIYKKELEFDEQTVLNFNTFRTQYPNAASAESLGKLDNDGVVKKGSKVSYGDILIASLQRRAPSPLVGMVSKKIADRPKNNSTLWTSEDEGTVIDVQKTKRGVSVFIKTEEKAKIGDKLAGRHGNKGVITAIIPSQEAPRGKDGVPVDIMLNPHGVISRINVGQIYESALAKAADKAGTIHTVDNFSGENYLDSTKKLMAKSGVDDEEELFDTGGKSLGKVHVGKPYILKLFKQTSGNFSVRQGGPGNPYDQNQQPVKVGGEEGTKSLDLLTMYSMLSHGARANLREMSTLKAGQNDEYWMALKSGQQLPPPKASFAYDKFIGYLKGAGIDVKKDGTKQTLAPLTDKEINKMSSGEIKDPRFYRAKDLQPVKDGFFDPVKFGGFKGTKWGHIDLKEATVNPVFETAVRKLTGLGNKFDDIMDGKLHLNSAGKLNTEGSGVTGGKAIEKLLNNIDVEADIASLQRKAKTAKGNDLDDINKKLRYLLALQQHDLTPTEAYIRKTVPVVPPMYRPVYALPSGDVEHSGLNFLYQNVGVLNDLMDKPVMALLAEEEKADIRRDMYKGMQALSGLKGDPVIKGRARSGFISEIKGGEEGQPKEGFFISKLLSKRQDFVGRGTIIPEPNLGIDQVALPEQMSWKMFEPFVIRELKNMGKNPLQAIEEIKKKTPLARKALEIVMSNRVVLLNRAPSLHKFSIMAFKPQITDGKSIKIPPLVTKGFNADFDGDTMTVHLPIGDEAVQEAHKLLPSQNLYQPGTGKLMIAPGQEAQLGLYYLSQTQVGRDKLNKILGPKFKITETLNKKNTNDLLTKVSKDDPKLFGRIVQELKLAGDTQAYDRGFSIGLGDLTVNSKQRDAIIKTISSSKADPTQINAMVAKKVDALLDDRLKGKDNALYDMVASGARGDKSQLRSILFSPLYVSDAKGRTVPSVIKTSYSEGLSVGDYWTSLYGARKGMIDRSVQTSLPGSFSKDIMATTIDNVISAIDCGTKKGVMIDGASSDVLDRYLAGAQFDLPHNTLINASVQSQLRGKKVLVRSPITCLQPKGTCSKCFGIDEKGALPGVGDNIGAKAGQAIAEPLIQLVMNTFHTGGVVGTGANATGIKRIDQLLKMPKVLVGSATLSPVSSTVTKIEPGVGGGFDITVGSQKAHVDQGLALKVKVGSKVERGDALSEGVIKPQELLKYKGMRAAQEYVVDGLHQAYASQGSKIDKRIFETVVRSLTNTTSVTNNPKGSSFIPGDVAPYTVVEHHNENLESDVPLEEAMGHELAITYGMLKAGTEVTDKAIKILKLMGHNHVKIKKEAIEHDPQFSNITQLPLLKKDWMGALGYRNLAKVLTEGAGQAWSSDLESYHPVPAFAYGASFGKGKDGKY